MTVLISCSGKVKIQAQIIFSETVSSPCVLWEQPWSIPAGFQWDVYLNKGWYHLINPCNQVATKAGVYLYSPQV